MIPLQTAKAMSHKAATILAPYCERIEIAGSIRREKPYVKDIEIVCVPLHVSTSDLFGQAETVKSPDFIKAVRKTGAVVKGSAEGRYCQLITQEGVKIDLFMPVQHDYYRMFAIRTGSATYSFKVIATGWKIKGWCGTADGLRKIVECQKKGSTWTCQTASPTLPPAWQSEHEFFAWLGVKYICPTLRT